MPKKIDPSVKERCVRQVLEHLTQCPVVDRGLRARRATKGSAA
ncbi:MAG: hypothetical protein V9G13_01450 [Marmoricola sp.]